MSSKRSQKIIVNKGIKINDTLIIDENKILNSSDFKMKI